MDIETIRVFSQSLAKIVFEDNLSINDELRGTEQPKVGGWNPAFIVPVAEEAVRILKEKGFNFLSARGQEFQRALIERHNNPQAFGYGTEDVDGLDEIISDM